MKKIIRYVLNDKSKFQKKKKERVGESESKREREVGKETQKQNKKNVPISK